MKYIEHISISTSLYLVILNMTEIITRNTIEINEKLISTIYLVVGCLLPDIDHKESYISKRMPKLILNYIIVILVALMVIGLTGGGVNISRIPNYILVMIIIMVIMTIVPNIVNHRGPVHSIAAAIPIICVLILFKIDARNILAFTIGWVAHLVEDMVTGNGVAIMWPINKSKIQLIKYYRNQKTVTTLMFIISIIILVVYTTYNIL